MSDSPPQSTKKIEVTDSQVGVVGDHAHIEGGIHLHVPPSRLGALLGSKERIVTLTPDQQRRNRENFLSNIKATWIDGYLHNAVHHAIFIELGIEYKRDAVSRPWDLTLQPSNQPIPSDKPIGATFREHGRSLLILGEPASGKTITMLQLAEELLTEAKEHEGCPIPVVLNLSSWAREHQPLPDWLAEEMLLAYQVSRPLTRAWLEANAFALLLDGLDEVDEAYREDCITAINDFKAEHQTDMVVCSRIADYEALSNRLNLSTAIRIQPLTSAQIDAYLGQFGPTVDALREALAHDQELQELLQSPLALCLMPLAYGELSAVDLAAAASLEGKRRRLFAFYVRRTCQHRPLPKRSGYDQSQALLWLTNLAQGMVQCDQSVFYIERLEPKWLPVGRYRRHGLLVGLSFGLSFGLLVGLIWGLLVGLVYGLVYGLVCGLILGLFFGIVVGPVVGLRAVKESHVTLSEELHWSPPSASVIVQDGVVGLGLGLVSGLIFALFLVLMSMLVGWRPATQGEVLSGMLVFGLLFGLLHGLILGLNACVRSSQTQSRTHPNQGVRSSFRTAVRMGSLYTLVFGPLSMLVFELSFGSFIGTLFGLFYGLLSGLLYGLMDYGGAVVIQHYTLRLSLARQGVLPFPFSDRRLVAYLDAMADRILLRRVGGGWMFIHRYLLEYFASLHPDYEADGES